MIPYINIKKVTVLINQVGMDTVFIETDLPSPVPAVTDEPMTMRFEVRHKYGVRYVQDNFACGGCVIDAETGEKSTFRYE